jgi:hypothetical protein
MAPVDQHRRFAGDAAKSPTVRKGARTARSAKNHEFHRLPDPLKVGVERVNPALGPPKAWT